MIDRSQFIDELKRNPDLAHRIAVIVAGEVDASAPIEKQIIQAETIFNRATARDQSLEQVMKQTYRQGDDGYYPGSTFAQGERSLARAGGEARFRELVLKPVLAGSDKGTEKLGFAPTGNASAGTARNGIASKYYTQYKPIGDELYVQHQPDNIARLEARRTGESATPAAAPVQVALDGRIPSNVANVASGVNTRGLGTAASQFVGKFSAAFPQVQITSGYRDPVHNAEVGGAQGSQHLHGNAIDVSLKGLSEQQKVDVYNWARGNGATGIGYYPSSDSAHFDFRQGTPAAWGGNYSRTSLPQTPPWFQKIAQAHLTGAPPPQVAGLPPGASPAGYEGVNYATPRQTPEEAAATAQLTRHYGAGYQPPGVVDTVTPEGQQLAQQIPLPPMRPGGAGPGPRATETAAAPPAATPSIADGLANLTIDEAQRGGGTAPPPTPPVAPAPAVAAAPPAKPQATTTVSARTATPARAATPLSPFAGRSTYVDPNTGHQILNPPTRSGEEAMGITRDLGRPPPGTAQPRSTARPATPRPVESSPGTRGMAQDPYTRATVPDTQAPLADTTRRTVPDTLAPVGGIGQDQPFDENWMQRRNALDRPPPAAPSSAAHPTFFDPNQTAQQRPLGDFKPAGQPPQADFLSTLFAQMRPTTSPDRTTAPPPSATPFPLAPDIARLLVPPRPGDAAPTLPKSLEDPSAAPAFGGRPSPLPFAPRTVDMQLRGLSPFGATPPGSPASPASPATAKPQLPSEEFLGAKTPADADAAMARSRSGALGLSPFTAAPSQVQVAGLGGEKWMGKILEDLRAHLPTPTGETGGPGGAGDLPLGRPPPGTQLYPQRGSGNDQTRPRAVDTTGSSVPQDAMKIQRPWLQYSRDPYNPLQQPMEGYPTPSAPMKTDLAQLNLSPFEQWPPPWWNFGGGDFGGGGGFGGGFSGGDDFGAFA
jgi:Peptidase M15